MEHRMSTIRMGKVSQNGFGNLSQQKMTASSQNNEVYFMEFLVESTYKELRTRFHNKNGRSSALTMLPNNMEHPLLNNQMG